MQSTEASTIFQIPFRINYCEHHSKNAGGEHQGLTVPIHISNRFPTEHYRTT